MEKKKILFAITKGNFGGAQRYVYDLATGLPKTKYEALVAFGEGDILGKKLEEKGIRTFQIKSLKREVGFLDEFKVCWELLKLIQAEKPDVLHLNSSKIGGIGAVAGRLASLLGKNYSLKIIFTSHGWAFNEKHRSSLARRFYLLSHWITVLLCHQTIAVSEKTKRDIAWLPFIKNKITVIHNGIEEFETLPREEARQILDPENSGKIIIFSMSELHKNKGVDVAVKGINLLPENIKSQIIYVVAGDGEERGNLEKMNLEGVRLLGFVDNAKRLLSGADIFLLPSRTENLPFAVLEAGLVGLPIIATNVGGVSEVVHDMQNGILIHRENPKEIAEAIKYLLEHPDKKVLFGEKIKKVVSKHFSQKKMIRETISLY